MVIMQQEDVFVVYLVLSIWGSEVIYSLFSEIPCDLLSQRVEQGS